MRPQPSYQTRHNRARRYRSPYQAYFWLAFLLVFALTVPLYVIKVPLYLAYMISLNLVAVGLYGFDKRRAIVGGRRVPELILHLLSLLGGALGALVGQWFSNHKTRKPIFHVIIWLSLIGHFAVMLAFYQYLLSYHDVYADLNHLVTQLQAKPKR